MSTTTTPSHDPAVAVVSPEGRTAAILKRDALGLPGASEHGSSPTSPTASAGRAGRPRASRHARCGAYASCSPDDDDSTWVESDRL